MIFRLLRSERPDQLSSYYYSIVKKGTPRLNYLGEQGIRDLLTELNLEEKQIAEIVSEINPESLSSFQKFSKRVASNKNISTELRRGILNKLKVESGRWAVEAFPYIKWIGIVVKYNLPKPAFDFYNGFWKEHLRDLGNKRFFNFSKRLIFQKDDPAIDEVISSEATIRYLSGMIHALIYSIQILMFIMAFKLFFSRDDIDMLIASLIVVTYTWSLIKLIGNYKYMRIREVELLFDLCYKYRQILKLHF